MSLTINANTRELHGKGASRRLRKENLVPGVIYGGSTEPQSVSFAVNELNKAIENPAFFTSIIEVNVAGNPEKAIVKALQRHPARPEVLHIDLLRIEENTVITTRVPLSFVGAATSAGVKTQGGRLVVEAKLAEVRCLPANLPAELVVDCTNAQLGDIYHLSDAVVPEGVELVSLLKGEDHNQPIGRIDKSKR
ncbi:50S ribosomal protein L25/general stress protein Ctc [Marinomonas sp. 15G1-11]|uniref:Large ribosomal subunit protein bL25 n=1 Tax=Marinomonas phaeophyticola TaxID=3004091 RepID=A0ABT4JS03_9GAMM|nr:50S ribosomal protein L25/general stress protein Ctc [Marinomonas sp. 15G1-11]MCZ2720603.1 50S ribosomal protein L25/general stress protein Ctc [Marinomonas sp. 15G1-11]